MKQERKQKSLAQIKWHYHINIGEPTTNHIWLRNGGTTCDWANKPPGKFLLRKVTMWLSKDGINIHFLSLQAYRHRISDNSYKFLRVYSFQKTSTTKILKIVLWNMFSFQTSIVQLFLPYQDFCQKFSNNFRKHSFTYV